MNKHELLAPAGSIEIAKAVMDAGADAVYLAGTMFGARAYANNLEEQELLEVMDYAHLRDKKIFLTVNTLLKNKEIDDALYSYILPFYQHGLDAVIVQDFGVLSFLHHHFPDLPLHASTQMSVSNEFGASFLIDQGVSRIVTARELQLSEISNIYDKTKVEIESFIHGALCYSYSGHCLMSSIIGGRSGNRGRCAQPCRLPYEVCDKHGYFYKENHKYPLSPKDLCTIDLLPQLMEAGIYSFKIEGRMKQIEYAAGTTSIYRRYIDRAFQEPKGYTVEEEDRRYLSGIGSRGFTKGYYVQQNGPDMLSSRDSSFKKQNEISTFVSPLYSKIPIHISAEFTEGKPCSVSVCDETDVCSVSGPVIETAAKQSADIKDVKKRLSKTGQTPFETDKVTVHINGNCFIPVKTVNELRRAVLGKFQNKKLAKFQRQSEYSKPFVLKETPDHMMFTQKQSSLVCSVQTYDQLITVLKDKSVDGVDLDIKENDSYRLLNDMICQVHDADKFCGYVFPHIMRKATTDVFTEDLSQFLTLSFDRYIVKSMDALGYALFKCKIPKEKIVLDSSIYVFSKTAGHFFQNIGLTYFTSSFELNQKELQHQDANRQECVIYGAIPLMISAQCVYKSYYKCLKDQPDNTLLFLRDRKQSVFSVQKRCKYCYNIIYNSKILYLLDQSKRLKDIGFSSYRVVFTSETTREVQRVLEEYKNFFILNQTKRFSDPDFEHQYTRGHFKRSVE